MIAPLVNCTIGAKRKLLASRSGACAKRIFSTSIADVTEVNGVRSNRRPVAVPRVTRSSCWLSDTPSNSSSRSNLVLSRTIQPVIDVTGVRARLAPAFTCEARL